MNIHPSYHQGIFDSKFCHVIKSRNDLQIDRIDCIKYTQRGTLVIFLESDFLLDLEVSALIQGNNLIIEAPRSSDYEKPFKTHLIDQKTFSDYEKEGQEIGFSELELNHGFRYTILSCQMINSGLLKVILSFHLQNKNFKSTIN